MPILSDAEIYRLAFDSFGDLGRDHAVIFGAICLAESGGRTDAVLDNVAAGYQPVGSPYQFDRGLPQINSIHGYDAARLLSDPAYACACARAIYNFQGFGAWSTFNGGQFRAFMPRMEAAADAAAPVDTERVIFDRGRSELFFQGWQRDTVPVLRETAARLRDQASVLEAHADWVDARPTEWGIPRGDN